MIKTHYIFLVISKEYLLLQLILITSILVFVLTSDFFSKKTWFYNTQTNKSFEIT